MNIDPQVALGVYDDESDEVVRCGTSNSKENQYSFAVRAGLTRDLLIASWNPFAVAHVALVTDDPAEYAVDHPDPELGVYARLDVDRLENRAPAPVPDELCGGETV